MFRRSCNPSDDTLNLKSTSLMGPKVKCVFSLKTTSHDSPGYLLTVVVRNIELKTRNRNDNNNKLFTFISQML